MITVFVIIECGFKVFPGYLEKLIPGFRGKNTHILSIPKISGG